ncbi:7691_t:CDS:2 [Funneliformis geosporum]|uniref:13804_t:CDS:1 n=1 Tax=Funneliformis geosporum TaxID=1117311 RepID=A0A9W4WNP6_9GLOM|nr:7691_t:CDS:2 [Funneliformis geosporum]CAI2167392.1 13804_t:CDS:2 [Funneliformis geosporum]
MSFVQERVRKIQEDLDNLFQSLDSKFVNENVVQRLRRSSIDSARAQTSSAYIVSTDINIGRAEVLRKAIYSIQLDKGNIPKMNVILNQLDMVEKSLHGNYKSATSEVPPLWENEENEELERVISYLECLFLSKVTISIYGKMLESFLVSTLPLLDEIYYWRELEDNRFWSWIHLIQTIPSRVYSLSGTIFNTIRRQYQNVPSDNPLSVRQLFSLDGMINLFPRYMHTRFLMVRSYSISSLVRYEIRYKKLMLVSLMEYQAACLGLLINEGLDFKKITKEIDEMTSEGQMNVKFGDVIAKQLLNCVLYIERILNQATKIDIEKGDMPNVNILFDNMSFTDSPSSLLALYTNLRSIISTHLPHYDEHSNRIISIYGRPSSLTRWWLPITISTVVVYKTRNHLYEKQWIDEVKSTIVNFWSDWIWEPIIRMMETIRHRERRLVIMGKDSLNSDLESLERMVLDFELGRHLLNDKEMINLSNRVRDGDLSMILKVYEQQLKNPFRSIVTGNLIRTFSIQVQKTKVDLEIAMAALDKLLKSNELNFAFLAVGPSLFIVYLISTWVKNIVWSKDTWSSRIKGANVKMRESLLTVERLLVQNYRSNSTNIPFATQGLLICHVHHLRSYAMYLPSRNSLRESVLDDLRALDDPRLTIRQKIWACGRIWRCWDFLK